MIFCLFLCLVFFACLFVSCCYFVVVGFVVAVVVVAAAAAVVVLLLSVWLLCCCYHVSFIVDFIKLEYILICSSVTNFFSFQLYVNELTAHKPAVCL